MASNKQLARSLGRYSIGLVLSVVSFPSFASAQALIENSAYRGIATSSAACGIGIGLSANRPQAAAIGLPILVVGNIASLRLHAHHPKLAALVQQASGLGCLAGGLTRSEHKTNSDSTNSFNNSPSQGTNTGFGSNGPLNVPPGGASGSSSSGNSGGTGLSNSGIGNGGTGKGSGSSSGGSNSGTQGTNSGSSGASNGGSSIGNGGSSGSTGGIGGSSGNGAEGAVGGGNGGADGCITGGGHDCGLGNGGTNTGAGHGIGTTPPGQNGGTHGPGAGGLPPGQRG